MHNHIFCSCKEADDCTENSYSSLCWKYMENDGNNWHTTSHVIITQNKLNVQIKTRCLGLAFVQFWIRELG